MFEHVRVFIARYHECRLFSVHVSEVSACLRRWCEVAAHSNAESVHVLSGLCEFTLMIGFDIHIPKLLVYLM